jgi:hypothetical protein
MLPAASITGVPLLGLKPGLALEGSFQTTRPLVLLAALALAIAARVAAGRPGTADSTPVSRSRRVWMTVPLTSASALETTRSEAAAPAEATTHAQRERERSIISLLHGGPQGPRVRGHATKECPVWKTYSMLISRATIRSEISQIALRIRLLRKNAEEREVSISG